MRYVPNVEKVKELLHKGRASDFFANGCRRWAFPEAISSKLIALQSQSALTLGEAI
jgi:hypothetical protein